MEALQAGAAGALDAVHPFLKLGQGIVDEGPVSHGHERLRRSVILAAETLAETGSEDDTFMGSQTGHGA